MFDRISDERQRELINDIVRRRAARSDAEIITLHTTNIQIDYDRKFDEFANNYAENERIRRVGVETLKNVNLMEHFLVKENENAPHMSDVSEALLDIQAAKRLESIPMFSRVCPDLDEDEISHNSLQHKERLARYRKRRDWEAWVEEDELDLEGERLLAEIKNFKAEHFFSTAFYK